MREGNSRDLALQEITQCPSSFFYVLQQQLVSGDSGLNAVVVDTTSLSHSIGGLGLDFVLKVPAKAALKKESKRNPFFSLLVITWAQSWIDKHTRNPIDAQHFLPTNLLSHSKSLYSQVKLSVFPRRRSITWYIHAYVGILINSRITSGLAPF